jgi:hypothetical protein
MGFHLAMIDAEQQATEHCAQPMIEEGSHRWHRTDYRDGKQCRKALL